MIKMLYWLQNKLNILSENPLSLGISIGFLIAWTTCSLLSKNKFDAGLGIENLIINGLSILLLFSANSKRNLHADASIEEHKNTQELLENMKNEINEILINKNLK